MNILFLKYSWCDHVIVAPEDNKIIEFNNGISIGSNGVIPIGGHIKPSSMFGEILLLKNAQKNLMKNIISDVINIIILYFNNDIILISWWPWNDASRFTSRHHKIDIQNINVIRSRIIVTEISFFIIYEITIEETLNSEKEARIGQGLGEIKWNGCDNFCINELL